MFRATASRARYTDTTPKTKSASSLHGLCWECSHREAANILLQLTAHSASPSSVLTSPVRLHNIRASRRSSGSSALECCRMYARPVPAPHCTGFQRSNPNFKFNNNNMEERSENFVACLCSLLPWSKFGVETEEHVVCFCKLQGLRV